MCNRRSWVDDLYRIPHPNAQSICRKCNSYRYYKFDNDKIVCVVCGLGFTKEGWTKYLRREVIGEKVDHINFLVGIGLRLPTGANLRSVLSLLDDVLYNN